MELFCVRQTRHVQGHLRRAGAVVSPCARLAAVQPHLLKRGPLLRLLSPAALHERHPGVVGAEGAARQLQGEQAGGGGTAELAQCVQRSRGPGILEQRCRVDAVPAVLCAALSRAAVLCLARHRLWALKSWLIAALCPHSAPVQPRTGWALAGACPAA